MADKSWRNPFSRRRSSATGADNNDSASSPTSGLNVLSRPSSSSSNDDRRRKEQEAEQSARSLLQNPLPAEAPPPAYTPCMAGASNPTSRACHPYEIYQSNAHPTIPVAPASFDDDDPYAFLSDFDTVFLIDDSSSMGGKSWSETKQAVSTMLPIIFAHDEDGPDFYFMNHISEDTKPAEPQKAGTGYRNVIRNHGENVKGEQISVESMFSSITPRGGTPTGRRLGVILQAYLRAYESELKLTNQADGLKPLSIIVITDGAPQDDVSRYIVQAAKKLDSLDAPPSQVGIQFFQVGNQRGAAASLRALDDDLKDHDGKDPIRDIVDTVSFDSTTDGNVPILTAEGILKAVLGSVLKRLDKVEANLRDR